MSEDDRDWPQLRWLETFLAVIDNDGVQARAAEAMGVSASTISRDLAALDAWLRTVLIIGKDPCELTKPGRKFEKVARPVVSALLTVREEVTPKPLNQNPVKLSVANLKIKRPN